MDLSTHDLAALHFAIRDASANSGAWPRVVEAIAGLRPGSRCKILGEAHEGASASRSMRIGRTGFRIVEGGTFWSEDCNPLGSAGRRSGEIFPLFGAEGCRHGHGAALVLHRCPSRDWLVVLGAGQGAPGEWATECLDWLAPTLIPAFRISLALAAGMVPSVQDCGVVWDRLDRGVVVLSRELKLLRANVAAEELLSIRGAFRPLGRGGGLRLHCREADERLERAVACALADRTGSYSFCIECAAGLPAMEIVAQAARRLPLSDLVRRAGAGANDLLVLSLTLGEGRPFAAGWLAKPARAGQEPARPG